jgi:hypothetical protein
MTIDPATIQHMHDLIASFPGYDGYPDNTALRPAWPAPGRPD